MSLNKRTVAAVGSAAVVLGVGAGLADAAHNSGTHKLGSAGLRGPGPGPGGQAIADYLGLTSAELRTQLEAGKTPADIATAQGNSVSGLEDVIVPDAKTHLDAAATAGKITAAAESTRRADRRPRRPALRASHRRVKRLPRGRGRLAAPSVRPAFDRAAPALH